MHPVSLILKGSGAGTIFEILDKETQTKENTIKDSECSSKSYKLPLPRDLDPAVGGEIKAFTVSQVLQDRGCPKSFTFRSETTTEEVHPDRNSPCDFSNRYRYCKEVIKPCLKDDPPDCLKCKELLLTNDVIKVTTEFPENRPHDVCYKCPPPPCPPPPCPPKCPPPPCPPKCPPKPRNLKNHLKICYGEEGPTICKECSRHNCPSFECPKPYIPPCSPPLPCPPVCRPECPLTPCPHKCSPPPCPPRCCSPPPCSPPKCCSPPPCPPPKCCSPPPCPPPKCCSPPPCPPPPCSPPPCPPPPCPPPPCPAKCPPPPCPPPPCPPPPCPAKCPPPPCPPPPCPPPPCPPPPCPPPPCPAKCPPPPCPPPPCPPPPCPAKCPPTPCPPPPCPPPPCPPPPCPAKCKPPPCPPPPCPPPPCPPPPCPPKCPPPKGPPPPSPQSKCACAVSTQSSICKLIQTIKSKTGLAGASDCKCIKCPPPCSPPKSSPSKSSPPPNSPPPSSPSPSIPPPLNPPPRSPSPGCPDSRGKRKFLCPNECSGSKNVSNTILQTVESKRDTCSCDDKPPFIIANHHVLETLKCAMTDLMCKAFKSTQETVTDIKTESARQLASLKKSACFSDSKKSDGKTKTKLISKTHSNTSVYNVVNLDTSNEEEKVKSIEPHDSEMYARSSSPFGFILDKVDSVVSMVTESLIYELPRPSKSFNNKKSDTPTVSKPPSPADLENMMCTSGTYPLFVSIQDMITSMFTGDNETKISPERLLGRSSADTLVSETDEEDFLTMMID